MKERVTVSIEPEALETARAEVESGRAPNVSAAVEESLRATGRHQAMREAPYGKTSDVVDAHVASCAVERRAVIATSDRDDIEALIEPGEPVRPIAV